MSPRLLLCLASAAWFVMGGSLLGETESRADRESRLANLPAADKAELRRQQERLTRLPVDEQEKLRQLERDLTDDPQGEQLRAIMLRYNEWLRSLNSRERTELLNLPVEQRIGRIKSLLEEQERQRFQDLLAVPLQPEDQRVLMAWVNNLLRTNEQSLLEKLPPLHRQRLKQVEDPNRRLMMLVAAFRLPTGTNARLFELVQPTDEQINDLRDRLSSQSRAALNTARDASERKLVIQNWTRAAIESRLGPPINKDELQRFWNEHVTAEQREYLESLPPDRRKQELQRLYQRHHFNSKLRPGPFGPPGPRRTDASTNSATTP